MILYRILWMLTNNDNICQKHIENFRYTSVSTTKTQKYYLCMHTKDITAILI